MSLNVKQLSTLVDGLKLNEEEINHINQLLLKSMKKISKDKVSDMDQKIESFTHDKTDVNNNDVLNFMNDSLDPNLLNEILSKLTDNNELMAYIQDLVFDKLLD
jgi:flagellar biosynthesis/type III secretory pathway M-ring protein FliF/YscJ